MSGIINRDDLRDHGESARINRVWERLERNIVLEPAKPSRKPAHRLPLVAAAIAAGFAGGFFLSEGLNDAPTTSSPVVVAPADDHGTREVYAAGAEARSYPLPGGGTLHVTPGTIVDTVVRGQGGMTLRLVRGEATLTTPNNNATNNNATQSLGLKVGRAEVTTAEGSMRVRLDGDTAALEVINGTAALTTPDEDIKHRVLRPSKRKLRVRVTLASNTPTNTAVPGPLAVADDAELVADEAVETTDEAPLVAPAWVVACNAADYDKAVALLSKEPGGLAAGLSGATAQQQSCIASGLEESDRDLEAIALNERTASDLSASVNTRMIAASNLARLYRQSGNTAAAAQYQMLFSQLSKGTLLSESGLCNKIQLTANAGNEAEFARLSESYSTTFPDGDCTETIAQLAKDFAAKKAAAPPASEDEPAGGKDKSEAPKPEEDAYEGDGK
jgi:hypothetical protein